MRLSVYPKIFETRMYIHILECIMAFGGQNNFMSIEHIE